MKFKHLILAAVAVVVILIIYNTATEPGVGDLKGDFKEVAFYRNENNTGPIKRVYVVTVSDTLWEEMQQYGEFMPHTKYGSTKVYFFSKDHPYPKQLKPGDTNFDRQFEQYVLAKYEKDVMSQVSFKKLR